MIEKINSKSRITEVDNVSSQILAAYLGATLSADQNLLGIITTIQPVSDKMSSAIKRIKSESELEEKDELRDNAVRSLFYLITGYTHHPDSAIREPALKIMSILDNYGLTITSESYATESSLIKSLLLELEKRDIKTAIELLSGAPESVVSVQNTQNNFVASHLVSEQNKAEEGTYENATSLKKEMIKLINGKLVVYLKAMILVDEETYGSFVRTIAQIIADNNEIVKKRTK